MAEKFYIAVACGGTGGHIFPGLATARALREGGHHVTLWLSGKHVEHTLLQGWKGSVVTIPSEGFQFGPLRNVWAAFCIGLAVIRCWIGMLRHRPDAVLAMGSYSSIGPCLAARLRGIPYILHEANAVPGKAVRLLAKRAAAIAICFEETRYHLKGDNVIRAGMPLRPELQPSEHAAGVASFSLLVMGGSAGAHAINEMVSQALSSRVSRIPNFKFRITHLTGSDDESYIRRRYEEAGVDADVRAFTPDMVSLYEAADLAVCRAGASTCAELGAFGLPALLIPYPHAASDHQTANARALEKLGAVDVVQQIDCTAEWLSDYISAQIEDPARIGKMRAHALRDDSLNAAEKLKELVEQCAKI